MCKMLYQASQEGTMGQEVIVVLFIMKEATIVIPKSFPFLTIPSITLPSSQLCLDRIRLGNRYYQF